MTDKNNTFFVIILGLYAMFALAFAIFAILVLYAVEPTDCSPNIKYPTQDEEIAYCVLKEYNPNCDVLEDLTVYCKE